jgi:hypothetical protein
MEKNVGAIDRLARLFFGVFVLSWAIAGGPYWAWLGVLLIYSGAYGKSRLYHWLKFTTRS